MVNYVQINETTTLIIPADKYWSQATAEDHVF